MSTPATIENLSPTGQASSSAAVMEREAIEICDSRMNDLQRNFPAWYELFEETIPDNAPRAEVVELLRTAPNDFSMGLMYGKFTMRIELEAVTSRAFA